MVQIAFNGLPLRVRAMLAATSVLFIGGASAAQTLQSSIDQAMTGDTIYVQPGTYSGNLNMNKSVTLVGMGQPVLRGEGSGSVVTITADSCSLIGFLIEHSGRMLADEDAGVLIRSNHNTVKDNRLNDVLFGIYLFEADSNIVLGNVIVGRPELGLGERGSGIHVWNSYYNTFIENNITAVRDGFYIQYATHTLIERCEAFSVRYGVHYMYADSNTFLLNSFHDNVAGAALMYSYGIRMTRNVFSRNRGFSSYGILIQDCHGVFADSNIISDNGTGMFFESTTENSFQSNVIRRNDVALFMFQNSTGNVFSGNDFVENLTPLIIVGKQTGSAWSDEGRGNYWSSYDGYDLDGDGTGDVPMKIQDVFQYMEGQIPAARLYLYSPASQALALAARLFPVLDRNTELDNFPLMRPETVPLLSVARPEGADRPGPGWAIIPLTGLLCTGLAFYQLSKKNP